MTTAIRNGQVTDNSAAAIPVPGASIYVYNFDGSAAALTSDGITPLVQPLTTDSFGNYSYTALVGYYREDTWFDGKLRFRENNIAVGSPGADLALRTDLAAITGASLVTTKRTEAGAVARTAESILRDTVCVRDFGAVGDGVTDDTAAFNLTHTAAAATGAKVYVPATANGYLVAGTIVAKASMFGDGEATVLKTSSATADVIQVGVPNVAIGDLAIQQTVTRTGGYYINFNAASANQNYNSRVERCTFNNWFNCIGFNSVGAINTVRVRDCFLTTNVAGGVGVLFNLGAGDGVDVVLRDLFIIGASSSVQPAAAVQLGGIGDITLDHVSTVYCANGVLIQPGTGLTAEAIFINDCLFDSGTGAGIKANPSGTGTVSLLKIENAWSCTNLHGLLLTGTGFIQRVEVVGGYFCNNASGYGINAGVVQYLDVTGGTYAANINGINIAAGVSNFKIAGARCGPAGLFIQNSGFGIVIAAGASTNFSIVGCDLTGNTGGTLSNGASGASGIVVDNLGVNPGSTNTVTVTASPFTYTAGYAPETAYINGGTVSAVTVGGQNLGITSGAIRLGPKQAVTVTYSAAPTMVRTLG